LDLGARKILIVDDVRFTRLTLAKIIGSFGAPTILEAGDGESALAVLQHEGAGTDCIITDLDMPKLDGVGLLQAVRTGRGNVPRDTKVVLLTGHSELDRIGPALHFDVDAFLAKPASHRAIEACFQRLFGTPPASPVSEADHAMPPMARSHRPCSARLGKASAWFRSRRYPPTPSLRAIFCSATGGSCWPRGRGLARAPGTPSASC
jgi:two-component system, chemotaxis family, chemotaxis protein CheY